MFQCSTDTSTSDTHHACNFFYSSPSAKQLPDLLVATNAHGMAAPAFPLGRLGSGRLRRRYLSSKLPCHLFEQTLVMTKELLQCFGKILLKMKSIDNVFRLGSASRCGLAKELAAIARDDVHLGMVLKPGGT